MFLSILQSLIHEVIVYAILKHAVCHSLDYCTVLHFANSVGLDVNWVLTGIHLFVIGLAFGWEDFIEIMILQLEGIFEMAKKSGRALAKFYAWLHDRLDALEQLGLALTVLHRDMELLAAEVLSLEAATSGLYLQQASGPETQGSPTADPAVDDEMRRRAINEVRIACASAVRHANIASASNKALSNAIMRWTGEVQGPGEGDDTAYLNAVATMEAIAETAAASESA